MVVTIIIIMNIVQLYLPFLRRVLHYNCWEQLEQLQSECSDKENSIGQLRRQLRDNTAELDSVQQQYGVYMYVTVATSHCVMDDLFTSDKGGGTCFCPCLFVCLSVCLSVC